ncbi:MAG: TerC/Alx family metal homeostasis membrane protein [Cytophagales bacterium]|nr:TerC/Alx family metal homeostasis membrane protein [Bernardetiaceae bacterium]MDW8204912.1 TerC/Alx family metal homeostasis membrane protein [Cytophagales bacterium]
MFSNEIIFFTGFTLFIVGVLALDLGLFSKKDHIVKFKEAAAWSAIWVLFALGFYVLLDRQGHLIHDIQTYEDLERVVNKYMAGKVMLYPDDWERSLAAYRDAISLEFITGYLLEYSLSIDNIFVIIMIFTSFGVREKYYKKVLFWGILGAIVMRFIFIFVGAALIQTFSWIMYLFGAFLIYTSIKMFLERNQEENIEPAKHPVVRWSAKWFRVYPRYVRNRFFVKKHDRWHMTPLFVVVMIIEFTDLIFAVDSVPAVFAVTRDPYLVFFSNIFAILGLRSMFFFLSNIVHIFHYLKLGLSVLLAFIGMKMIGHHWLSDIGFTTVHSLYVILGILSISIIASLLFPVKTLAAPPLPAHETTIEENIEHVKEELVKRLE